MEMPTTAINKECYAIFYHPCLNNLMFTKIKDEEYNLVKNITGKGQGLKSPLASTSLSVRHLYDYMLEALYCRISFRYL